MYFPMSTQPFPTIVITGPTASGKSSLAISIAQEYGGEIISADSRQVYRGMDIGTGKVTPEEQTLVPHHLLDIRNPHEDYNVTDFQRDALEIIENTRSRNALPIVCGGTAFWIQALIEGQKFPSVPPNPALRKTLEQLSAEELFAMLRELNPDRARSIDAHNPVRLIRAIEIARSGGGDALPPTYFTPASAFQIAPLFVLNPPFEELKTKIRTRLNERFDQGMTAEVSQLHDQGISWERLERFGLEYRFIAQFLQGKLSEAEMREQLFFAIVHYAKRQLTWLRRWERHGAPLQWFASADEAIATLQKNKPR